MGRAPKKNADYFFHSSTYRSKDTSLAIRRRYGHEGYSVWLMLQERLADADYWKIEFNNLNLELLAGDFDVESERLKEMIDYFIKLNLLEEEDGFLFDPKLIEEFTGLVQYREKKRLIQASKRNLEEGNSEIVPGNNALRLDKISLDKISLDENRIEKHSIEGDLTEDISLTMDCTVQPGLDLITDSSPGLPNQSIKKEREAGATKTIPSETTGSHGSPEKTHSNTNPSTTPVARPQEASFDEFWKLYDKQVGMNRCLKIWKGLLLQEQQQALAYIPGYKKAYPDAKYRKNPEKFLLESAWKDKLYPSKSTPPDRKNVEHDFSKYKLKTKNKTENNGL